MAQPAPLDCIVVGAGAAGLTCAIYLARFRRRVIVIDSGASRLLTIPTSHNYPGFAGGIHGGDILQRLRAQAAHYGTNVVTGVAERIERRDDGCFAVASERSRWHARTVVLATGVQDVEPGLPDVRRAVAQGCVRYCPICDGYEAIDKKVAVLGRDTSGLAEALFLNHFTRDVSLFALRGELRMSDEERVRLARSSVRSVPHAVTRLTFDERGAMTVWLDNGRLEHFDMVYAALGTLVNSGLAQTLGARCTDNGELLVDDHQQTSVDGLYAAGDVVAGLNQITVAMGQAAIAATAVHNRLRG
ncbi:NAD(P)/FAD-dependent oxidoreductase [Noviherbaspirillum sp. UKPF54]|uniref:NAD(P)/FAD-dependent oxidoreductase n=1 Tax=Noviherbaspirillum sp. UKPF54 TaxID=2601898 RepID=UPI0011B1C265|nr:NAD(P)/FAD-dependent oxidoreductase [Noviherbaspirillum sp. UKPF54]QDZ29875.1 NAD(P)/FAD-dependent oxidoreductase [Noviherbaspirillum sp. UKPF54]